jgi:hypothetical protein
MKIIRKIICKIIGHKFPKYGMWNDNDFYDDGTNVRVTWCSRCYEWVVLE